MHLKPVKYNLKTHLRLRDIRQRLDMMSVSQSWGALMTFIDNKGKHYVSTDKKKEKKKNAATTKTQI